MKLTSPKFKKDEDATEELIEATLSSIKDEVDSFVILSENEMTYIQALKVEQGFVVQFQCGSTDQHYEFVTYLSRPKTISLFKNYLAKSPNWQDGLRYEKVNLHGVWYIFGRSIGRFIAGVLHGFKAGRSKA